MKILVGQDYDAFSILGGTCVRDFICANPGKLLCFAAGDTPLGIFNVLVNMQARGELDLNTMYYVGLDEWVGIGYETKGSCAQTMHDAFYGPAGIEPGRIRAFDGLRLDLEQECVEVNRWIEEKGGIALTLLGIGMNGHIGFNEPFTDPEKEILVVDLDEVTAEVGKKYFDISPCPTKGITVGIKRLSEAQEVILAVNGHKKGEILRKTLVGPPTVATPSSLLQNHDNLTVVTDTSAFQSMWKENL